MPVSLLLISIPSPSRYRQKTERGCSRREKVRANGATALYDTLLEGLADLGGKNRPALVLFTDGVDANHNDTGPGSVATKGEVLAQVAEQNIPVLPSALVASPMSTPWAGWRRSVAASTTPLMTRRD